MLHSLIFYTVQKLMLSIISILAFNISSSRFNITATINGIRVINSLDYISKGRKEGMSWNWWLLIEIDIWYRYMFCLHEWVSVPCLWADPEGIFRTVETELLLLDSKCSFNRLVVVEFSILYIFLFHQESLEVEINQSLFALAFLEIDQLTDHTHTHTLTQNRRGTL